MQKTTKIIVNKKTLERPPLNIYGKYFKLYLPVIKKNQLKEVTLSFKVNIADNIRHQIIPSTLLKDQPNEIVDKFLTANIKMLFSNLSTKQIISHLNFQKTQKLESFIFLLSQVIKFLIFTDLNKTWLDTFVYFKQMKNMKNIRTKIIYHNQH